MGQVFVYHLLDKPLPGHLSGTPLSFMLDDISVEATVPSVLQMLIESGNMHVQGKKILINSIIIILIFYLESMIYIGKLNKDMWVSKGQYQQACSKNTKLEFMPSGTGVPTAHILMVIFNLLVITITNIISRPLLSAGRLRVARLLLRLAVYPLVADLWSRISSSSCSVLRFSSDS